MTVFLNNAGCNDIIIMDLNCIEMASEVITKRQGLKFHTVYFMLGSYFRFDRLVGGTF